MDELNNISIKKLAVSTTSDRAASFGILVSRITISLTLAYYLVVHLHQPLGIGTHPVYAVAIGVISSMFILLGILTRPSALILILTILCYNRSLFHDDVIHPWLELLLLYTAFYVLILFSGAGRYSLDSLLFNRSERA